MASFSFRDDFSPDTLGVEAKNGQSQYGILPKDDEKEIFCRTCEFCGIEYDFICSLSDNFDLQKSLLTLAVENARIMASPRYMMRSDFRFLDLYSLLREIIKSEISQNAVFEELNIIDSISYVNISEKGFLTCIATLFMFALQKSPNTSLCLCDSVGSYRIVLKSECTLEDIPPFVRDFCQQVAYVSGFTLKCNRDAAHLEIISDYEKITLTTLVMNANSYMELDEVIHVLLLMSYLQKSEKRRKEEI